MGIRKKLQLSVFVSGGVAFLVFGATLTWMSARVSHAIEQTRMIDEVVRGVFELATLSNEYLLHHEERARLQWQLRYASLGRLLAGITGRDPDERSILDRIIQGRHEIEPVFQQLIDNYEDRRNERSAEAPEREREKADLSRDLEQRVIGWLSLMAQTMIADTRRLATLTGRRANAAQRRGTIVLMSSGAVIAFLVLAVIVATGNRIVTAVTRLREGTGIIAGGDLSHRVKVAGHDEIAELAIAFNVMARRLTESYQVLEDEIAERRRAEGALTEAHDKLEMRVRERTAELSRANADLKRENAVRGQLEEDLLENELRFRELAENIREVFWMVDAEEKCVLYVSPAYEEIWGRSTDGLYGEPNNWIEAIHADDRERVGEAFFTKSSAGEFDEEYRVVRPDGTERWVRDRGFPMADREGKVYRIAGIAEDITEQKRAEEDIKQTAEALARSNEDLQQFAYVASHDLQEPLRMVVSYMQLLEQRYKGSLDEEADTFIDFAVDGAKRMQALIRGLLAYSRVGSRDTVFEPVDCDAAVIEVTGNLAALIDQNRAVVTRDALPTITGDRTQLLQLFQNLIGNAIKFQGKGAPRVEVSARRGAGEWAFAVRDNGIGIEAEYADRVFAMFQRLHGRAAYPGSGVGLAICKRIVDRHGGRIWFESIPGQGTTFYFTVPASVPAEPELKAQ